MGRQRGDRDRLVADELEPVVGAGADPSGMQPIAQRTSRLGIYSSAKYEQYGKLRRTQVDEYSNLRTIQAIASFGCGAEHAFYWRPQRIEDSVREDQRRLG